jgi:hypothetical protein
MVQRAHLSQPVYEEGHKICWKGAKVLQMESNTARTGNAANPPHAVRPSAEPTQRGHPPIWTLIIAAVVQRTAPPFSEDSTAPHGESVSSVTTCCDSNLSAKAAAAIQRLDLGATPHLCAVPLMFSMSVLTLADGLRCAWFRYPILCWCRCLQAAGSSCVDWGDLSRCYLEPETEHSLRNVNKAITGFKCCRHKLQCQILWVEPCPVGSAMVPHWR